ncbi:OmpA family protein [Caulobacter vibrioides]|uniref:OmpA family protein n=2 Tax=Caulobacter vibrioides TaxID=155892 RepID=Q9ABM6_CAUVC|nr:OmpA family protein [Caulobacter vibrioides]YP_002515576.1 outer membrane protein [Caulobacter vibrioides NA1000]AAK22188.1 OmpA family protein [Caulobacter vibrioides CB15]ACL93668.1 outer membrane protein [Caulobacter vibrioides NA1000]ATC27033.1 OmpA family protein [Caulobacter vibrioides]QXZ52295.1 OmpA family protein [Caulobacter vibrioides]
MPKFARKMTLAVVLMSAGALAACTTTDPYTGMPVRNNTGTGALTGAGVGAVLGYLTNTNKGEQGRKNALIGAGIGALAGGAIGNYMDRQQADFRRSLEGSGVMIRRNGDQIVLVMPSDVTFAVDRSDVQPPFTRVLDDVARTLNAYPQTTIDVVGHADSSGPDDYNQTLSERRASAVAGYLTGPGGVLVDRVFVAGMGERAPIADNATADGRAQNRRVEIILRPLT